MERGQPLVRAGAVGVDSSLDSVEIEEEGLFEIS